MTSDQLIKYPDYLIPDNNKLIKYFLTYFRDSLDSGLTSGKLPDLSYSNKSNKTPSSDYTNMKGCLNNIISTYSNDINMNSLFGQLHFYLKKCGFITFDNSNNFIGYDDGVALVYSFLHRCMFSTNDLSKIVIN